MSSNKNKIKMFICNLSGKSVLLVFLVFVKYYMIAAEVRFLSHPVPIPNSPFGRGERQYEKNVQFQVQNVAEGTYHFGYNIDTEDVKSYREERRESTGRISGIYGYRDPNGVLRVTEYEADSNGFRSRNLDKPDTPSFQLDHSNLQFVGPIPKPFSYVLTRDDYN